MGLFGSKPPRECYRMPAESEPHERTWIGWPQRPDKQQLPASEAYAAVAQAVARFEPVVVCAAADQVEAARGMLPGDIKVLGLPVKNSWVRDTGPTFVEHVREAGAAESVSELRGIAWDFDEWGTKEERSHEVASAISKKAGVEEVRCRVVGRCTTLLTTKERFFHHHRKPDASKKELEELFGRMLGARKVIWLPKGLFSDTDTAGHIDNMACFARPGVVLLAWTDDDSDPQHERSVRALEVLGRERDACGRRLRVVKVPLPPPLAVTDAEAGGVQEAYGGEKLGAGDRIPASYVNLYICNGGVVMPAYGEEAADARVKRIVQAEFPGRLVVAVPSRPIAVGGGTVHCITQQQPSRRAAAL